MIRTLGLDQRNASTDSVDHRAALLLTRGVAQCRAARRVRSDVVACDPKGERSRSALEFYLRQIEPLRLGVNRLLNNADPILEAFRERKITPAQAATRMDQLERRFAAYPVDVQAIQPGLAQLRSLQAEYAHIYILEDAYLSALANGLAQRELDRLPDTQSAQRAAIIDWRTGLTVLARQSTLLCRKICNRQVAERSPRLLVEAEMRHRPFIHDCSARSDPKGRLRLG